MKDLADKINALPYDERQRARLDQVSWDWLAKMTEEEKGSFIETTLPTGFKQMLTAFEQLPPEKRRSTIDDAVKRLRQTQTRMQSDGAGGPADRGDAPALSDELEAKIRAIGLKTFYTQSSAETKAELAPVLEELQRVMENGKMFRRR